MMLIKREKTENFSVFFFFYFVIDNTPKLAYNESENRGRPRNKEELKNEKLLLAR